MMQAWAFACKTADEVTGLLRALGRHRYVRSTEHRIHWLVDAALAEQEPFASHASAFAQLRARAPDLDVASYDPRLWRVADIAEVCEALAIFWSGVPAATHAALRLSKLFDELGLPPPEGPPFSGDVNDAPHHPLLIDLSWTLFPIDELDAERHKGAVDAMEAAGEEVNPSAIVYHEGPDLGIGELVLGAPRGVLGGELLIWADGPYAYSDYVFRGASKMAKLVDPPEGLHDI